MKKCVQLIIMCCVLYHAFAHVPVCFGASGIRSKKRRSSRHAEKKMVVGGGVALQ